MIHPKNLQFYRFNREFDLSCLANETFQDFAFTPCGSQDISKFGFVPPICTESSSLVHSDGGHHMLAVKKEEKIIPAACVRDMVNEKVKLLEQQECRRLAKKERDAIKDDVITELLPRALTKSKVTTVYFIGELVIVDSAGCANAESALALIRKAIGTLPVIPVMYAEPIESTMTEWIKNNNPPATLIPQNGAYLVCASNEGGKAQFKDEDLQSDEVQHHIDSGKQVHKLDLHYGQSAAFTLHSDGAVKKFKLAEEFKSLNDDIGTDDLIARYDADFVLVADLLKELSSTLEKALGGYEKHGNEKQ
ncbi:MAG: recombination-associated protein RdgC [Shewanella sp.]